MAALPNAFTSPEKENAAFSLSTSCSLGFLLTNHFHSYTLWKHHKFSLHNLAFSKSWRRYRRCPPEADRSLSVAKLERKKSNSVWVSLFSFPTGPPLADCGLRCTLTIYLVRWNVYNHISLIEIILLDSFYKVHTRYVTEICSDKSTLEQRTSITLK